MLSHVRKLFTLKAVLKAKFLSLDKSQLFNYLRGVLLSPVEAEGVQGVVIFLLSWSIFSW